MSLNFAAISPHPPIIIPEIGSKEDLQKVSQTIFGMRKLANHFREAEIDTLVVISPHSLIYPDRFNICGMKKLFGTFASFGTPDLMMEFSNDIDFAIELDTAAKKNSVETLLYNNDGEFYELDHGTMVPLYYLTQNQESPLKIVPVTYSDLPRADHFSFGQIIRDVAVKYNGRVGVLASGDLSHRLIQSPAGKEFDDKLIQNIRASDTKTILYYDEDFVEKAGECGYRSILILLGLLDGLKTKPEVISYEGPFGVGYLVANYILKD